MTKSKEDAPLPGNPFAVGQAALETVGKAVEINLEALGTVLGRQADFGIAMVRFGGDQFRSLGNVADPGAFLQSQKEAGETFRAELESCAAGLRASVEHAQSRYRDLGAGLRETFGPAKA